MMKKFLWKMEMKRQQVKVKIKAFLQDETSARGSAEEGYLVYAGLVIGIIILGIAVIFFRDGFTTIGNFFNDGVNGRVINPPGWGK